MTVSKHKILVVDDEKDVCDIIARGLQIAGFHAEANANPIDALSNVNTGKYDLVILDVKMPGIDGFELYDRIRSIDKEVKVCFLTAFDKDVISEFKHKFPYAEVPHIITKPIELTKLVQAIKAQLGT